MSPYHFWVKKGSRKEKKEAPDACDKKYRFQTGDSRHRCAEVTRVQPQSEACRIAGPALRGAAVGACVVRGAVERVRGAVERVRGAVERMRGAADTAPAAAPEREPRVWEVAFTRVPAAHVSFCLG